MLYVCLAETSLDVWHRVPLILCYLNGNTASTIPHGVKIIYQSKLQQIQDPTARQGAGCSKTRQCADTTPAPNETLKELQEHRGLSFISNRQRRKDCKFCALELAGFEPAPPPPRRSRVCPPETTRLGGASHAVVREGGAERNVSAQGAGLEPRKRACRTTTAFCQQGGGGGKRQRQLARNLAAAAGRRRGAAAPPSRG